MRRRKKVQDGEEPKQQVEEGSTVTLPYDTANEAALVAAAFLDPSERSSLLVRIVPDHMQGRENRELWTAFQEAERRKLVLDFDVVEQLTNVDVRAYLAEMMEARGGTVPKNVAYHVANVLWDHARVSAVRGPIPAFIEALRDNRSDPETVKALARAVAMSFEGHEDRKFLLSPEGVVRDAMKEIEARVAGRAIYSYGVDGLDFYETVGPRKDWPRRMLPGPAPGQVTVVTAISGGGKSTFTAHMVLGMAFPGWRANDFDRPGRKIIYGAWEMNGRMTLELLACISLGWSRSQLMEGKGPSATPEGRRALNERMDIIAQRVRFMENPFRRNTGEKASNQKNLDLLQGYIGDSGCEVFVGDLWKRCLAAREQDPGDEEEALIRQQAMTEELKVHAVLLQQQRMKDIEGRADKRPTREGIKGSGAWVEVADTIIGVHRPGLVKSLTDDHLEVFVLKQRYGKWPLGVDFEWNADSGSIAKGMPIPYDRPGEQNEIDARAGLLNKWKGGR